jgi:AraC-like DNA-binding protein
MHTENENVCHQVLQHVMTAPDEEFVEFSVGTLAHSFNVDRFKLSRQFKREINMTLEYFLFKEKMDRAAFLLKAYRNIPIKEIAVRIGFCSSDYFIRKFKEYYGVVPGKYREFKASNHS